MQTPCLLSLIYKNWKGRYRSAKFKTGYKLEKGITLSFKEWNAESQHLKFKRKRFLFTNTEIFRYIQISSVSSPDDTSIL